MRPQASLALYQAPASSPPLPAKPYCEDCARRHGLPDGAALARYYGFCPRCGIKRVCIGKDPDPLPQRTSWSFNR